MISLEFQTKLRLMKEVLEIYKDLKQRNLDHLFLDITSDAQHLGCLILMKELESYPDKKIKNWPGLLRNISVEILTKGPKPIELMDLELASKTNAFSDNLYLNSFYIAHLFNGDKDKKSLNDFKAIWLKAILKILSTIVLGIDPASPIEIKSLLEGYLTFNYEKEILNDQKLREDGLLPRPEEILENFKKLIDSIGS